MNPSTVHCEHTAQKRGTIRDPVFRLEHKSRFAGEVRIPEKLLSSILQIYVVDSLDKERIHKAAAEFAVSGRSLRSFLSYPFEADRRSLDTSDVATIQTYSHHLLRFVASDQSYN